ncbi:Diacetyl reductase [(S)-acetoin forming] (plasmid) [Variovorax sp. SRS16]|uniref:SDR family NAD(P)-dependent oxidoreductase n=1 Tax=Variovorax sp. SRS16 TaxID=282217 RepID=UPI0013196A36|nr:SDR family NAD(P)-dependent oxidoreductase [Variovorax sp. SRS16]VTU46345.1 Diacetyl reductase [(S)-acetoin forming] [Variovorax sp. SRS16]
MKDLNGRTAFVTGGASGIGLAMVECFLREGMNVMLADLSEEHLEQARARLHAHSGSLRFCKVDVADRGDMARAADETEQAFGKIHVLCNNAGVSSPIPMDEASFEDWDWILGVNLQGVINGIVTFLPRIRRHGEGGHIVNTSSIAGLVPAPAWGGIYTTSKFAVHGLSGSLRLSVGKHNIGVTVLCPGATRSDVRRSELLRPERYRTHAPASASYAMPSLQEIGIEPEVLGRRVVRAIRHNEFYVIAHAENKAHVRAFAEAMLNAFPDEVVTDEGRLSYIHWFDEATAQALALQPASDAFDIDPARLDGAHN